MSRRRISVQTFERVLVIRNGYFAGILTPGDYSLFSTSGVSLETERHDIRKVTFVSGWSDYLIEARPQLVRRHFVLVETTAAQVAMVYANESLLEVLTPAKRLLLWQNVAEIRAEIVDVIAWSPKRAQTRRSQTMLKP